MNSIALKLHEIKCVKNQEGSGDELYFWGVMLCKNSGLVLPCELIKRNDFDTGETKVYTPPKTIMNIPIDNRDLHDSVSGMAVFWMMESDNHSELWDHDAELIYNNFLTIYTSDLHHLGIPNAKKAFLNAVSSIDLYINSNESDNGNEVFPFFISEFTTDTHQPLHSRDSAPETHHVKRENNDGEYAVTLSWSAHVDNQHPTTVNPH